MVHLERYDSADLTVRSISVDRAQAVAEVVDRLFTKKARRQLAEVH